MKKIFYVVSILLIGFYACNDDDTQLSYEEQLAVDIQKIQKYLADSNLTAQSTERGLYYIIEEEGDGSRPTVDSIVEVKYAGRFLNDTTNFDSGTYKSKLNGTILGWRLGIPLFKEGGKGTLFLPSCLGYGIYGVPGIPGNSVLIFDIELLDVQD
ncbi:FKBP-type peptidyl-prolyl cis-trans isomerase [Bacteroidota bacterium]